MPDLYQYCVRTSYENYEQESQSYTCRNLCIQVCVRCEREYQEADDRNLFLVKSMIRHCLVCFQLIVWHHLQEPYPESKFVMNFWMNARFSPIHRVSSKESRCVECTGMPPIAGQTHSVVSFCRRKIYSKSTTRK